MRSHPCQSTDILHQYRKTQQQNKENQFLRSYAQNPPCCPFPVPCSLSKLASLIEGARCESKYIALPILARTLTNSETLFSPNDCLLPFAFRVAV